jgi:OOP family OmpA-OmpF porin
MSTRNIIFALAASALAQAAWSQPGENDDGFFVGAALGNFSTEIDDVDDANFDFDEDESASRIFAGFRFNNFFSAQLDRYDFSEASNAPGLLNVTADTKGWAPSVIGTLPLGPVELFIRGGILLYDVDVSFAGGEVIDESGEDPVYSAGIGFTVLERLNLKLEYESVEISEYDDAEAVWLSGSWRF